MKTKKHAEVEARMLALQHQREEVARQFQEARRASDAARDAASTADLFNTDAVVAARLAVTQAEMRGGVLYEQLQALTREIDSLGSVVLREAEYLRVFDGSVEFARSEVVTAEYRVNEARAKFGLAEGGLANAREKLAGLIDQRAALIADEGTTVPATPTPPTKAAKGR